MHQRPLTKAEATHIPKPPKPFQAILCYRCGESGYGGLHKDDAGRYSCNNANLCAKAAKQKERVFAQRKIKGGK